MLDRPRHTTVRGSHCSLCGELSERKPCYFMQFRSQFTKPIESAPSHHQGWLLTRCQSCRVVSVDPLPTEEELRAYYNTDYYTDINIKGSIGAWMINKSLLGEVGHWPWSSWSRRRAQAREVKHLINLEKHTQNPSMPIRFLDVGCGTGETLTAAGELGWDSLGIEVSQSAAERARQESNMPIICNTWDQVSLNSRSFDIIHLREVLEHTRKPGALLYRISDWLCPGGVLYIQVPNDFESYRTFLFSKIWWMIPPSHLHYFTPTVLSEALKKLGLKIVKIGSIADAIGLDLRRYLLWRFGLLERIDGLQGKYSIGALSYKLFQVGWDYGLFWPLKTLLNRSLRGFTFWLIVQKPKNR